MFQVWEGHVNYRRLNKVPLPHILCEEGAAVTSGGSVALHWLMHGVIPPPVIIPLLVVLSSCRTMLPPPVIIPPSCGCHCHSPSRPLQKPWVPDDEQVLTTVDQGLQRVKGGCIVPLSCPPHCVIIACPSLSHRICFTHEQ